MASSKKSLHSLTPITQKKLAAILKHTEVWNSVCCHGNKIVITGLIEEHQQSAGYNLTSRKQSGITVSFEMPPKCSY